MPLSPDQRAMLELVLERGQSYADIGSLLEVDEAEVRRRARAALTELGGADPDRNVGLTDWLLGQADPIGRADAVRHVKEDPEDHRLATRIAEGLREVAPGGELPRIPAEPGGGFLRRGTATQQPVGIPAPSGPGGDAPARSTLSSQQARLIAAFSGAAVILIVVVLALTGAFGGDDEPATTTTAPDETTATGTQGDENIAEIPLESAGGGDASGTATIGIASGDQPYIDLSVEGLEPPPNGQTYILWLLLTKDEGYPLTPVEVNQSGRLTDRYAVPAPFIQLLARVREIDISLAENTVVARTLQKALEAEEPSEQFILERQGDSVLRGSLARAPAEGASQGG
jgi:hypothetical protein